MLRPAALAVPLAVLAAGCPKPPGGPPKADAGPPKVTVAPPVAKTVTPFAEFTGTTSPVQTVQLRPRVSGYISRVNFNDGAFVRAGDVLFEIDPVPYEADLRQAQAQVKNFEAELARAKAEERRQRSVFERGAGSANELDVAVAQRGVYEAQVEGARAQVVKAKQNLEWTKVTAPISGKVDRRYLTPGNVATGGATEGTVLTTIVTQNPMYAYFDVDERTVLDYLDLVRKGRAAVVVDRGPVLTGARLAVAAAAGAAAAETAGITIPVYGQLAGEDGYPHHGTLDFVSNQINPGTGTLQIRGTFTNPPPDYPLVPGLFMKARVPMGTPVAGLLIPDEAVVTDQGQKQVYAVGPENKVVAKPVVLGARYDGLRLVLSGVSPDDRLIVRGVQRVQPGMAVDPQEQAGGEGREKPPSGPGERGA